MIKKIMQLTVASLLAVSSTSVFADDHMSNSDNSNMSSSDNVSNSMSNMGQQSSWGLVVGGQAGYATIPVDVASGLEDQNSNAIYSVFLGLDYNIIPQLSVGVEVGINYGYKLIKVSNNLNDYAELKNTYIIPILATIKYWTPVGINIFAKAGGAYVHQQEYKSTPTSVDINGNTSEDTLKGIRVALAGGLGYMWNNWNFFAQYMYVFGDKKPHGTSNSTPVSAITGGVSYTFPLSF